MPKKALVVALCCFLVVLAAGLAGNTIPRASAVDVTVDTIIDDNTLFPDAVNVITMAFGDVTNDGWPDLVTVKGHPARAAVFQHDESGWDGGTLLSGPSVDGAARPIVAPIRNDGQEWLVYTEGQSGNSGQWLRSHRYNGTALVENHTIASRTAWPGRQGPGTADLDGDGDLEVWYVEYYGTYPDPTLHLFRRVWDSSTGSFPGNEIKDGGENYDRQIRPAAGDFLGDGSETLIWAPRSTVIDLVQYTPGSGTYDHTSAPVITTTAMIQHFDTGEFDGAPGTDVAIVTWDGTSSAVLVASGDTFELTEIVSDVGEYLVVTRFADLDGDGLAEVYAAGANGGIYGYDDSAGWRQLAQHDGIAWDDGVRARWDGAPREEVYFVGRGSDTHIRIVRLTGPASEWQTEDVDRSATNLNGTRLDLDANGTPHIVYRNLDSNRVNYASYDIASGWFTETVHTSTTTQYQEQIAVDSTGAPHVVWHYYVPHNVAYAYRTGTDSWWIESAHDGAWPKGISIAIDSQDQPHVSYWTDGQGDDVMHAWRDGVWDREIVRSTGHADVSTSIAVGTDDHPRIAHFFPGDDTLSYAEYDGSTWSTTPVHTFAPDQIYPAISLALDSSDRPHIAIRNPATEALEYFWHDGNQWNRETVEAEIGYVELELDDYDRPHLSYNVWVGGESYVKYAARYQGVWTTETVVPGTSPSMELGPNGERAIGFISREDNVWYAILDEPVSPPPTNTPTPSNTPSDTPTSTPTNTPTNTPVPPTTEAPTVTPTIPPTNTPLPTNTPTATPRGVSVSPVFVSPILNRYSGFFNGPWEEEPNDDPLTEANGPIRSNQNYHGRFPTSADVKDYFYFEMQDTRRIELSLADIPDGHNYNLVLRDGDDLNNVVGYSARPGSLDEFILTDEVLPPGRYYVQVWNYSETASNEPYTLRVIYDD